jgi:hypothetical protein
MEPKPCCRVTKVVEDVADCERRGGPDDHSLLLRGDNRGALNMPDGSGAVPRFPPPKTKICDAGSGICIGSGQEKRQG